MSVHAAGSASARVLAAEAVVALRAVANRFGNNDTQRKRRALAVCERARIDDAETLIAYHDCLLFMLAYPEDAPLFNRVRLELDRVAIAARTLVECGNARTRRHLEGTGIAWTTLTLGFGYEIARWLARRHPRCAELDSFDEEDAPLQAAMKLALPGMEFELLADEQAPALAWLDEAAVGHRGSRLAWLIDAFEQIDCDDGVREQLFDALSPFITLDFGNSLLSRTCVRGPAERRFFHRDALLRGVDPPAILNTPLPTGRPLSLAHGARLIDTARAMLASLGRETDAIAAAWPEGVEYHRLSRGASIALFTMRPERRGLLDSHIGFLLFKNAIPIAYGGGWPFLSVCRIGVNVFAPFRGGESAWLFCQVLRVYRQRFGIERFVAEPSQFGAGNPEGLASGAFWFYYRLGFRPVKARIAAFAHEEFARLTDGTGYRVPLAALRRFTHSDIELELAADATEPRCDPADLSLAVSAWIGERHRGNRTAALAAAITVIRRVLDVRDFDRWTDAQRAAFAQWSLLLAQIPDLSAWPYRQRRALVALIRAKGSDEFDFHTRLRRAGRLRHALAGVVANAAAASGR